MTEGQIVAEAIRLARLDPIVDKPYFTENAIRHALRLATQPEQDPALGKAMAVWDKACEVWGYDYEAAARVIMKHYPAPPQTAVEWAKCYPWEKTETLADVCSYILTMAGEKQ